MHLYIQVQPSARGIKWNEKQQTKNVQSDNLLTLHSGAEFKCRTPKLKKVKENISKSTTLSCFFLYPTSNSIATLIVQQDQYIFIIILRYLLYFSEYLQLYKQSTHFKVHIFNTVLTSFAFTRFIFFPQKNNLKLLNKKIKIILFSYILQNQKGKIKKMLLNCTFSRFLSVRLVTSGTTKYFSRFVNI